MTIHQISIFLENKYGSLNELFMLLSKENIRIIAATVADTSEFGILRMIVSDPQKAYRLLKDNHVSVHLTEVLAITTQSSANSFAGILTYFTNAGLSIEYMYCFSVQNKAFLILKVSDREIALEVMSSNDLAYITESELNNI
jgi:hypothetical protein